MTLFDLKAYAMHQNRAQKAFSHHSFLFDHVGRELIARLKDLKKTFHDALNLSPHPLSYPAQQHPSLEQPLPFQPNSFDLVLSCLQAHWINDFPGFLRNVYTSLQAEGLFLSALWGGRTLFELRESLMQAELTLTGGVSPRLSPMLHPADAPTLLRRGGFFMPVVDTDTLTVTYPSLRALMRDLRGMGETNKLLDRPKTLTPRALFETAETLYRENFPQPNQHIVATFEVIFLTGWKYEFPPTPKDGRELRSDTQE
jgi:SAM-dependent methyltransferase